MAAVTRHRPTQSELVTVSFMLTVCDGRVVLAGRDNTFIMHLEKKKATGCC